MADEIAETYPCYFPLGNEGYLTVISDGDRCIPLLTDRDVVERFFRDRYPNVTPITVEVQTIRDRAELIGVLREIDAARKAGEHDAGHIAFDVSGQKIIPRATIAEFIDYLEIKR